MNMTTSLTDTVNHFITSLKGVIPMEVIVSEPTSLDEPYNKHGIGVLIGMTGDTRGRFLIDGGEESFQALAASMFGMPLSGEMLESFAGELGNMIVGNLATSLAQSGYRADITTPTVIIGDSRLYGFQQALQLPVTIEHAGDFLILFMQENERDAKSGH
ncbi:chemotaxis protein CheX [Rossellomorea aquimaris]|uniref:chemotaxis protein CheX n=1 Tax=Rossellomorea aquimaris TaxID=189382 RepID=UPI001CD76ACC|nr:chemotaxis protein CheX [Rossellomorea aquimaris]MCA1054581.1 chemotaxis protein CheX [Rossellomorea aquimaris]